LSFVVVRLPGAVAGLLEFYQDFVPLPPIGKQAHNTQLLPKCMAPSTFYWYIDQSGQHFCIVQPGMVV
jgi:hypothetical protein